MVKIVKIVCPNVDELGLEVKKNIQCPEDNCERIFLHQPALQMHLVKVHKIIQNEKDLRMLKSTKIHSDIDIHFHCPIESCKYNTRFQNHFKQYRYLKQHFMKVHAEKKYSCTKCGHAYSLLRLMKAHETKCNLVFRCGQCGKQFSEKMKLEEHCREEKHPYMFEQTMLRTATPNSDQSPSISTTSKVVLIHPDEEQTNKSQEPISLDTKSIGKNEMGINKSTSGKKSECDDYGKHTVPSTETIQEFTQMENSVRDKTSSLENNVLEVKSAASNIYTNTNANAAPDGINVTSYEMNTSATAVNVDHVIESGTSRIMSSVVSTSNKGNADKSSGMIWTIDSQSAQSVRVNLNRCNADGVAVNAEDLGLTQDIPYKTQKLNKGHLISKKNELLKTDKVLNLPDIVMNDKTNSKSVKTNLIDTSPKNNEKLKVQEKLITPNLLPNYPVPSVIMISPGNCNVPVSVINQNFIIMQPDRQPIKPRHILPKLGKHNVVFNETGLMPSSCTNTDSNDLSLCVVSQDEMETHTFVGRGKRKSCSTQTGHHQRKKHRKVAETQTTGDYILKKAMMSAQLPVIKESRGSQVSPRAKAKYGQQPLQSSQTQTLSNNPFKASRKKRRKSKTGCDFSTNTTLSPQPSSIETQTNTAFSEDQSFMFNQVHQSTARQDIWVNHNFTTSQIYSSCGLGFDMVSKPISESIAIQTADSYLSDSGCAPMSIDPSLTTSTQDSEIQTKLTMNMSLKNCDHKDLLRLQQLGITSDNILDMQVLHTPQNISGNESSFSKAIAASQNVPLLPINSRAALEARTPNIICEKSTEPHLSLLNTQNPISSSIDNPTHNVPAIAQADTAIDLKIAEFEKDGHAADFIDPMFSPVDGITISQESLNIARLSLGVQCSLSSTVTGVQTSGNDFSLPLFLSAEAQTSTFDNPFNISAETQTTSDDILSEFLTHMQTQTNDEFWNDLGFNDIQTQTIDPCNPCSPYSGNIPGVNVETQTSRAAGSVSVGLNTVNSHNVEVQAGIQNLSPLADLPLQHSLTSNIVLADIQTQTIFDESLTDSHTQTSWKDLMKFMKQADIP